MSNSTIPWNEFADLYAFLGNSLLKPMNQTAPVGLDPEFWAQLPDFGDDGVADSLENCEQVARSLSGLDPERAIESVSVEYTRLFIGPPSPAAAPWETFYRNEGVTVGFGEATFQMRSLLREAGLEVVNENHQYEDHLGIELLYLSVLCSRIAKGELTDASAAASFIEKHPGSWTCSLAERIALTYPDGYYRSVVTLIDSLLSWHLASLKEGYGVVCS